MVSATSINQDIEMHEFTAILAASKLLKADFPTKDTRWTNFYEKFIVMDQVDPSRPWKKSYSLVPTQIALMFLASGTDEVKAKSIFDLFSEH